MTTAAENRVMARKNANGNAGGAEAIEDLVKAELKRIGDSSVVKTEEIQARLMEVEQKLARRGAAHAGAMGVVDVKSIGSQIKDTQELEMFLKGATPTTRIALDVKSIVSDGATPSVSPFAQNVPGIQAPVVRRLTVESLIPSTPVTTGSVQWLRDDEGRFLVAPGSPIWGMAPVVTEAIAEGSFIVADLLNSATIWDREQASLQLGYANDNFIKNAVTLLVERRLQMSVTRPAGINRRAVRGGGVTSVWSGAPGESPEQSAQPRWDYCQSARFRSKNRSELSDL